MGWYRVKPGHVLPSQEIGTTVSAPLSAGNDEPFPLHSADVVPMPMYSGSPRLLALDAKRLAGIIRCAEEGSTSVAGSQRGT
jgi:hypothetical protein